jgi:hypothetical protein
MLHTRSSVKATRGREQADIDDLADTEGVMAIRSALVSVAGKPPDSQRVISS